MPETEAPPLPPYSLKIETKNASTNVFVGSSGIERRTITHHRCIAAVIPRIGEKQNMLTQ